ncbi:hypothetical protein ACGFIW_01445 [Micromonospora sp. NPDC048935]|uniref:hypothetical protein n=1 Tax=Micromonospora sp. NPDC048935 TaxID=3364262 RepID=UPI0037176009
MRRTITDTADRLRNTDTLTVDGKPALILNIDDAATPARPARLALTVSDPHGCLADLNAGYVTYLDAGDTVTFEPGSTHLADVAGRRPGGPTDGQIAGILAFESANPIGRVTSYTLFSDEAIEQRRAELAAERAANPVTNESVRAMLADLHR